MNDILNEEALFRFVDGECSPTEELEILQAEQEDSDVAQRIRDMRKQNAVVRAAMDLELAFEISGDIASATSTKHTRVRRWSRFGHGQHKVSLLVACLIAAIGLGTAWSHWRITRWEQTVDSLSAQREATLANAIQEGLESYLSGEAFEVNDPNLDFVAVVQPKETYRSTSGHWCRRFSERVKIGLNDFERQAIACRENDTSNWTRVQTVIDGPIEDNVILSAVDRKTE